MPESHSGADFLEDLEAVLDAVGERVPDHVGELGAAGEAARALGFGHRRDEALVVPLLEGDGPAANRDVELVGRGGEVGVDGRLDGQDAAGRERRAAAVVLEVDGLPDAFRDVRPAAEHPRHGIEEEFARIVVRDLVPPRAEEVADEAHAVGRGGDDRAAAERSPDVGDGLLVAGVDVALRELDEGGEGVVVSVDVDGHGWGPFEGLEGRRVEGSCLQAVYTRRGRRLHPGRRAPAATRLAADSTRNRRPRHLKSARVRSAETNAALPERTPVSSGGAGGYWNQSLRQTL